MARMGYFTHPDIQGRLNYPPGGLLEACCFVMLPSYYVLHFYMYTAVAGHLALSTQLVKTFILHTYLALPPSLSLPFPSLLLPVFEMSRQHVAISISTPQEHWARWSPRVCCDACTIHSSTTAILLWPLQKMRWQRGREKEAEGARFYGNCRRPTGWMG